MIVPLKRLLLGMAVVALAWILAGCAASESPVVLHQVTVTEAATDTALIGSRITVSGVVARESWDGKSGPATFSVLDPLSSNNARLRVVFDGTVPDTFGDDRKLRVTGTLTRLGTLEATAVDMEPVDRY